MIGLRETNSPAIAAELVRNRLNSGSPVMGMVMTFVIVTDADNADQALSDAQVATQDHPARLLIVIRKQARGASRIDAEVGIGHHGWAGELARIELNGPVVKHAESVVLPLLLPDLPVAAWWPGRPPAKPGEDPIGILAKRRITDVAAGGLQPAKALRDQCIGYTPGNTDLAWARITPWRALLAAALDQHSDRILSCEVISPTRSPGGMLLRAWLQSRLRVEVHHKSTSQTGIQKVILHSASGDIAIDRTNSKKLAQFVVPGQPAVPIALPSRTVAECLAEELRRLDEDEIYRATVKQAVSSLWPAAR